MFVLVAFCRALPLKLARSFPLLHSHALMRAPAFTFYLSSPLSPTRVVCSRVVSLVRIPRHSRTLSSSFFNCCHCYRPIIHISCTICPSFFLHYLLHIHFLLFNSVFCLLLSPPSSSHHHLSFFPPLSASSYVGCMVK